MAKILVVIPLCDYEPIATRVWYRRITHQIVKYCLRSFVASVHVPLDVYILTDRASEPFITLAQKVLAPLKPVTIDNSKIGYNLDQKDLSEKGQHVANQLLKAFELAKGYDLLYFCEQDYIFKDNALVHAIAAFEEIHQVNVLSMFDHPDRHNPALECEYGKHRYYPTSLSIWKSVSSTNGNIIWRVSFINQKYKWLLEMLQAGHLDYGLTNGLYWQGELLLSPVESLIQHFRFDGSGASPTFGRHKGLFFVSRFGRIIRRYQRLRQK